MEGSFAYYSNFFPKIKIVKPIFIWYLEVKLNGLETMCYSKDCSHNPPLTFDQVFGLGTKYALFNHLSA